MYQLNVWGRSIEGIRSTCDGMGVKRLYLCFGGWEAAEEGRDLWCS